MELRISKSLTSRLPNKLEEQATIQSFYEAAELNS